MHIAFNTSLFPHDWVNRPSAALNGCFHNLFNSSCTLCMNSISHSTQVFNFIIALIKHSSKSITVEFILISHSKGEEWKRLRSSASKQIVPRRVANYAPGLCEIGDGFVEYIRRKRRPDGYLEDVYSAVTKWAFQG